MTARTCEVNFLLRLMGKKDLRYAERAAAAKQIELTTAACSEKLFKQAEAAGYGERDMSAVVEVLRANDSALTIASEQAIYRHHGSRLEFL